MHRSVSTLATLTGYQLFDLDNDPHELSDLSADPRHVKLLANLRLELADGLRALGDPLMRERND